MNEKPIFGFNFYRKKLPKNITLLQFANYIYDRGARAIEISCLKEVNGVFGYKPLIDAAHILKKFQFVSIHASNYVTNKEFLDKINKVSKIINLDAIVFHPNDIDDAKLIKSSKYPITIENLDNKHDKYTTLSEMYNLATTLDKRMIIDVAHLFMINEDLNTWPIDKKIINKTSHFHLSGVKHAVKKHGPLNDETADIIKLVSQFNKPIIIEGSTRKIESVANSIKIFLKYCK